MKRVYMDHSATTPTRREVIDAMVPYFGEEYGNPSSVHSAGQRTREVVEEARRSIALQLGASPDEIVFTSGGTESDNLAIGGVAAAGGPEGHVITSAVEHKAVLKACEVLEKRGHAITRLPVDEYGRVDPADLRDALRPDTVLVSIMTANNEVGTIQPVAELAAVAAEVSVPFHTDAVQAVGKIPVDVDALGVDLLSLSAHKFYGPKGVGALYVRAGTRIEPMQVGGHHEGGRRAGTENVPGIVGMAEALRLACAEMSDEAQRLRALRDHLQEGLMEAVEDVRLNGHPTERLPHLLNLSFTNVEGESMLLSLDAVGVCVSTGSACTSGTLDPSHVLIAMGIPPEVAHGSLRFSLGRQNTREQVEYVLQKLPPIVERLRQMSPLTGELSR
ncbi:MAG: cysteine desulfurase NifS [Candidatus Brocadiaceae bacterium]